MTRQPLHQIVYRWSRQDLFGRQGLGPAATSMPVAELARVAPELAGMVGAEFGGDGVPPTSTSLVHVDAYAAVVHRVAAEFEQGRLGNNAHVLLGTRTALTPHVALALDGWAWRNGQPPLGDVPPGHRLARVPSAVLDETLAERAFTLRDAARARADELTVVLAAVLRRPAMGFSLRIADTGGDPVALLWGLFDLVTVPLPGPLTFSTFETSDDTGRPRFVIVPRWPSQLWSGRHRIDPNSEARTDVFRAAADFMVQRYVEADWDTMYPLLTGLQGLRRYAPYDRAAEIRDRFAPRGGTPPPRLSRRDDPPRDLLGNPVEQRADDAAVEAAVGAARREAVDEAAAEHEAPDEAAVETAAEAPPEAAPDDAFDAAVEAEPYPEPHPEPTATDLEPEAFPATRPGPAPALPERPEEPPPSAGMADRVWWTRRGVYEEDVDALEFAVAQLADGGADRAVAFVEDVVALVAALELGDVRLLPYVAAQLPHRFDDAPAWTVRERRAVRYALARPDRYGARLAEADVARDVVRTLLDRLARVVLSLEKDPAVPLRALARDMLGDRRKLPPYPLLDDVLRHSSWEHLYYQELGRRWAELHPVDSVE